MGNTKSKQKRRDANNKDETNTSTQDKDKDKGETATPTKAMKGKLTDEQTVLILIRRFVVEHSQQTKWVTDLNAIIIAYTQVMVIQRQDVDINDLTFLKVVGGSSFKLLQIRDKKSGGDVCSLRVLKKKNLQKQHEIVKPYEVIQYIRISYKQQTVSLCMHLRILICICRAAVT